MSDVPYGDPAIRVLDHFAGARDAAGPDDRLREVRKRALALREELLDGPEVAYFQSVGLVRVPYPTRYGLRDAATVRSPLLHILNRLFIVQVATEHGLRTILGSPSDVQANRETPFFKRLGDRFGRFQDVGQRLVAPVLTSVEDAVAAAGLAPEDVDYITYDHLHTQDVRRWLGAAGEAGVFPNAKLLVTRQEWASAQALLPPQRDWYCPDGTAGVPPDRVVLLDDDVAIGGYALVRTPGHTEGNHSMVARTPEGVMVTSENGIGPDAYAPLESRIPGVRRWARETGMEVVLNANTMEGGLDQYISMVLEKTLAGPSQRNPAFPNMVCSSELTSYWAFPGIKPTFGFGDLRFGEPARRSAAA